MTVRRVILVVPGLLKGGFNNDLLREKNEALSRFAETSVVGRIAALPNCEAPEAAFLGIDPTMVKVAQGPLTVAALRHDPPERSVHFHLSLASIDNSELIQSVSHLPDSIEEAEIKSLVQTLDSKKLTLLWGEGVDHALVWEDGSIDLGCIPLNDAIGKRVDKVLPEGDGERLLRQLIDDSVNLLNETDFNKRRIDEGKPRLNLLWPWGQGFRPNLPNLALRRGEIILFESRSMRLDGLVRLSSYKHGSRQDFGRRLQTDWSRLSKLATRSNAIVIVAENIEQATKVERWEEAGAMLRDMVERFVVPLATQRGVRLLVVAPSEEGQEGLSMRFDSELKPTNTIPFDTRALDDRRVPVQQVWEAVASALSP